MTATSNTPRVTSRDIELLVMLYRYRCLSTTQIHQLVFTSDQTAKRRLLHLASGQYVRVIRVPGVTERVVVLARRGAALVADRLQVPEETITYATLGRETRHPFFVQHHLDVTDVRMTLERECLNSPLRLLGFLPEFLSRKVDGARIEKYLRDVVAKGTSEEIAHVPDGVFAIEHAGQRALFLIEIDRGTEVVGRPDRGVLKAMRFYLNYLRTNGYQRYRDDFRITAEFSGFRMLFITTTSKRVENIRKASEQLENTDDVARRFIWLAHRDQVRAQGILRTAWVSLDPTDKSTYTIAGDIEECR